MEETKRNSVKLDIQAARLSENEREQPVELYKSISEVDSAQKLPGKCVGKDIVPKYYLFKKFAAALDRFRL